MTKSILLVLALSASTLLLAHDTPKDQGCPSEKSSEAGKGCANDPKKLPKELTALELSDTQKAQILKIREEGQALRKKQQEQIQAVLTPEQRGKLEYARKLKTSDCRGKEGKKSDGGKGCENCK